MSKPRPIARYEGCHDSYSETIRRAALTACINPHALECDLLGSLDGRDWPALLNWLDVSGLSLYLFDQLTLSDRSGLVPAFVFAKLQQNLTDNLARTHAMFDELCELSTSFGALHLSFALLKGLSLYPLSVRLPWLRSQADIDFLIAERDAQSARRILENRGFHLHAISGRSWEFRAGPIHTATFENMYRVAPFRSVDLHLESCARQDSLLARTEQFTYKGASFTRLAPTDLMLGQGLHLYKHVCSEFFRAAHVLEFHNHLVARKPYAKFWNCFQLQASYDSTVALKLGVVTLLTTNLCGGAVPESYLSWSVDRLPAPVRLWVERYGIRGAFRDAPGSKLYLLLQAAMAEAGVRARRPTLRVLFPLNVPRIASAPRNETWPDRLRRYRMQVRFIRSRFRFHLVEGSRYLCESIKWSKERREASATRDSVGLHRKNKEVTIR